MNTNHSDIIQLLLLILLVSGLSFYFFLQKGMKQIREKEKHSIFRGGNNRKKADYLYKLYSFFVQFSITRKYLKRISKQYEIIMPGDTKTIQKETMKTSLIVWGMDLVIILVLLIFNLSLHGVILTITYLYIVNNQTVFSILEKQEIKLLRQVGALTVEIGDNFEANGIVEDVLLEIKDKMPNPVKRHIIAIYEVLTSDEKELKAREYESSVSNRFLKILLSLCLLVEEHGDKKIKEESIFKNNLNHLRRDIENELLRKERLGNLLKGFILVAVLPALFVSPLKKWALYFSSDLGEFYNGAFGIIVEMLIFICTIGIYNIINQMKETNELEKRNYFILNHISRISFVDGLLERILNKNYGKTLRVERFLKITGESISVKQFTVKQILSSVITFLIGITMIFSIHRNAKINLIYDTSNLSYYSSELKEEEIREIENMITTYVTQYKKSGITVEELEKELPKGDIINKEILTFTAVEIVERINSYQNEYFKWYELVIVIGIAILAYYIPYWILLQLKEHRQKLMDDEIALFQSIILMLMYLDRMTVDTILNWMEKYANIFYDSIQECLNNMQSGDIEALEKMKEKEAYEPFIKLINKLQLCDSIAIEKAFSDIPTDRNSYYERRKLENEIEIGNKVSISNLIVWFPFLLTSVLYLTVPMLWSGLVKLDMFFNQLNQILEK